MQPFNESDLLPRSYHDVDIWAGEDLSAIHPSIHSSFYLLFVTSKDALD